VLDVPFGTPAQIFHAILALLQKSNDLADLKPNEDTP